MTRALRPAVLVWALGFGVFLAVTGGAVVGPPDPFSQVVIAGALLAVVVPVVYRVLAADGVRSRRPLPYLAAATLGSALAVAAVPVPATDGPAALLVRGAVFFAAFCAVSWLTVRRGRDAAAGRESGE